MELLTPLVTPQAQANSTISIAVVSGTAPTVSPAVNTRYQCGTLSSLTITEAPMTGAWSIVFSSGTTATSTAIPAGILGLEHFAAKPNTIYEIDVLDNRAVVGSWAVSAS